MPNIEAFLNQLPRLKTPIQLSGLLFAILCGLILHKFEEYNYNGLIVIGLVGIAFLAIPLAFRDEVIRRVPENQRVFFLLSSVVLLLASLVACLILTVSVLYEPTPGNSKFDAVMSEEPIRIFKNSSGEHLLSATLNFVPFSKRRSEGATVFTGVVVIHDAYAQNVEGFGSSSSNSCAETPSCVGSYYFSELDQAPIFVPGGDIATKFPLFVKISRVPKVVKIWWIFYQREIEADVKCSFDPSHAPTSNGGVPHLTGVKGLKRVNALCYGAVGNSVQSISEKNYENQ